MGKKAKPGVENTIVIDCEPPARGDCIYMITLFGMAELFDEELSFDHGVGLLENARRREYKAGDVIVKQGDYADEFFVIAWGWVCASIDKSKLPDEKDVFVPRGRSINAGKNNTITSYHS